MSTIRSFIRFLIASAETLIAVLLERRGDRHSAHDRETEPKPRTPTKEPTAEKLRPAPPAELPRESVEQGAPTEEALPKVEEPAVTVWEEAPTEEGAGPRPVPESPPGVKTERPTGSREPRQKTRPPSIPTSDLGEKPMARTPRHTPGRVEEKPVEPVKRGGRPRGATDAGSRRRDDQGRDGRPKPELVCWERGRRWMIGVEVPEEFVLGGSCQLLQNETPLPEDESYERHHELVEPLGSVSLCRAGRVVFSLDVGEGEDYLLFKLVRGRGRRVRHATLGQYLVVVAESWIWAEETSGVPAIAPEPTSLSGYRAHFFTVSSNEKPTITFCRDGKQVHIPCQPQRCRLCGEQLADAAEGVGPLFGSSPPTIRIARAAQARSIGAIVLGQEGPGRNRWRMQFTPDQEDTEQPLPGELASRGGGWYFLRFYDTSNELVESLDFRFMSALKQIRVSDHPSLPDPCGHSPVEVEFIHDNGCSVLFPNHRYGGPLVITEERRTRVILPPNSGCDRIPGTVEANGASVEVTVATRRIWWAVGEEDAEPADWVDTTLEASRKWFAPTSTRALWLRFPVLRLVNKVYMGFQPSRARSYRVPVDQKEIAIPLREFGEYAEIENHTRERILTLRLNAAEADQGAAILRIIQRFKCKEAACDFGAPNEEEMVSHIKENHATTLVRRITDYIELQSALPELKRLPRYIHKCNFCQFYAPSYDNRPDAIFPHSDNVHNDLPPDFWVVRNVDEVRRHVFKNLPEVHICKWGCVLKEPTQAAILKHLLSQHLELLYERE